MNTITKEQASFTNFRTGITHYPAGHFVVKFNGKRVAHELADKTTLEPNYYGHDMLYPWQRTA